MLKLPKWKNGTGRRTKNDNSIAKQALQWTFTVSHDHFFFFSSSFSSPPIIDYHSVYCFFCILCINIIFSYFHIFSFCVLDKTGSVYQF